MEIEQVKNADTPNEMRAAINRLARDDALTGYVMHMADLHGMSGEDRYTMLAYHALKQRQEGMQRESAAARIGPVKPMIFRMPQHPGNEDHLNTCPDCGSVHCDGSCQPNA